MNARRVTRPSHPCFGVDHRNKKNKRQKFSAQEKSGGSRGYLRPRRNWISFRDAGGREGKGARRIVRGTSLRAGTATAAEVPPSHPRVPVIDSSDVGRFIRKCFRVSAGLRARLAYTSSNFQIRAQVLTRRRVKLCVELRGGEEE